MELHPSDEELARWVVSRGILTAPELARARTEAPSAPLAKILVDQGTLTGADIREAGSFGLNDKIVEAWMFVKTTNPQRRIAEARSRHPGASLAQGLLHDGLVTKDDLREIRKGVLEELGLPLRLGSLELVRELGRGGMGVVLEAMDHELGRVVAMKVTPGALALMPQAAERFMRECRAVARLNHPGIVKLYRTGSWEGILYAVMEYVRGQPLDEVLRARAKRRLQRPIPPRDPALEPLAEAPSEILQEFAHVAEALGHAHEKGIIHRDLKPSNLMVDVKGRLRILDFGLAHLDDAERLTFTGDILGTPLYMSPEQVWGGRLAVDARTDIYSLGATLYEAFALRGPFTERSRPALFDRILFKEPPYPSLPPLFPWAGGGRVPGRRRAGIRCCCSHWIASTASGRRERSSCVRPIMTGWLPFCNVTC